LDEVSKYNGQEDLLLDKNNRLELIKEQKLQQINDLHD
jgi:hypothetical protein